MSNLVMVSLTPAAIKAAHRIVRRLLKAQQAGNYGVRMTYAESNDALAVLQAIVQQTTEE